MDFLENLGRFSAAAAMYKVKAPTGRLPPPDPSKGGTP
jgi:hypothetical protein